MRSDISKLLDEVVARAQLGGLIQVAPYSILVSGEPIPPKKEIAKETLGQDPDLLRLLAAAIKEESELPSGRIVFQGNTRQGTINYAARIS